LSASDVLGLKNKSLSPLRMSEFSRPFEEFMVDLFAASVVGDSRQEMIEVALNRSQERMRVAKWLKLVVKEVRGGFE